MKEFVIRDFSIFSAFIISFCVFQFSIIDSYCSRYWINSCAYSVHNRHYKFLLFDFCLIFLSLYSYGVFCTHNVIQTKGWDEDNETMCESSESENTGNKLMWMLKVHAACHGYQEPKCLHPKLKFVCL